MGLGLIRPRDFAQRFKPWAGTANNNRSRCRSFLDPNKGSVAQLGLGAGLYAKAQGFGLLNRLARIFPLLMGLSARSIRLGVENWVTRRHYWSSVSRCLSLQEERKQDH